MANFRRAVVALVVICAISFAGFLAACSNAYSSNNNTYTYGDASSAVTALTDAILRAALAPITNVAYVTTSGSTNTFTFVNYYSATSPYITTPYTLTGSIVQTSGTTENGTVNFTGGAVTQMTWTNVTSTPSPGGTYTITFYGSGIYVYNIATQTFTLQ